MLSSRSSHKIPIRWFGPALMALLITVIGLGLMPQAATAGSLWAASRGGVEMGRVVYANAPAMRGELMYLDIKDVPNTLTSPGGLITFDAYAYCMEPTTTLTREATSGFYALTDKGLPSTVRDPARLLWTLHNSFPALSASEFVARAGASGKVDALTEQEVQQTAATATQAAVYRYSNGFVVSSSYRYDTRTTTAGAQGSALFWSFYNYLMDNVAAADVSDHNWRVWDTFRNDSQDLVEVPSKPVAPTPSLKTTATDKADGDKVVTGDGIVTDRVAYTGLAPNTTYVLKGELMIRNADGSSAPSGVTGSRTFTTGSGPGGGSGSVDLDFTIPAKLVGKTLVAFETLYAADAATVIAEHKDINDAAQTVTVCADDDTAFDLALRKTLAEGQGAKVSVGDTATFAITVFNQGEVTARDIAITDTLPAGLSLQDPDWTVGPTDNQVQTRIPGPLAPGASTTVDITVKVTDARSSYVNTAEISAAKDDQGRAGHDIDSTPDTTATNDKLIDDEINKTPATGDEDDHDVAEIAIDQPTLSTSATDQSDGDKTLPAEGGVVSDVVTYTNLISGKTYVVKGELMDKATGSGTGIKAEATFTATSASGSVTVDFKVPAGHGGKTLVVFETLYAADGTTVLAEHHDLDDAAQTVSVRPTSESGGEGGSGEEEGRPSGGVLPNAGAEVTGAMVALGLALMGSGATMLIAVRRRRSVV